MFDWHDEWNLQSEAWLIWLKWKRIQSQIWVVDILSEVWGIVLKCMVKTANYDWNVRWNVVNLSEQKRVTNFVDI